MLTILDRLFDPTTRRICGERGEQRLSPKATGVLLALAETPGRVWSRDALLERVWPNVTVGEEVLTHAVAELRRAFGDSARTPLLVETIHKSGYRLMPGAVAQPESQAEADPEGSLNLESYANYLEASLLFERGGLRNWERALALFAASAQADRTFAPAYAGLAKTLLFLNQHYEPRAGSLEIAIDNCATSQRLAPDFGEAFAVEALAHAMHGDSSRARQLFGKALRIEPHSHQVHFLLGRACFAHLDPRLAPPMLERAAALHSDDFQSAQLAATASEMIGDFDRAQINFAVALRRAERWLQTFPNDYKALSGRAHCLIQLRCRDQAESALATVCSHEEPVRHSPACALALHGELDKAMDALEQSVDEGWRYAAWLARDPCLHGLRKTPRFNQVARAIGVN